MKFSLDLDTVFNGSGDDDDHPLAKRFLAQRKWILLCGAFVTLVDQGHLSLGGRWLIFEPKIDLSSSSLLMTISGACILFALYMAFSSFAFLQKFNDTQRKIFNSLGISKKETIATENEHLNLEKQEIDEQSHKIDEEKSRLSASIAENDEVKQALSDLNDLIIEGVETTIPIEVREVILKYSLRIPNTIGQDFLGLPNSDSLPIKLLNLNNDHTRLEINTILAGRESKTTAHTRSLQTLAKDQGHLEARREAIDLQINDLNKKLTEIQTQNQKTWDRFYQSRVGATIVSLMPTFLSSIYCIYYFLAYWQDFSQG